MLVSFVSVLLLALTQEPNAAEKLFRAAEKKVADAESLHVTSKGQLGLAGGLKIDYKVNLWTTKADKSRVEDIAVAGGQEFKYVRIFDGESWWDIPPEIEKKAKKTAPKNLNKMLATAATRCGVSLGYAWCNDFAAKNPNLLDEFKLSDFTLGKKEMVGERNAQIVHYKLSFNNGTFSGEVWLDEETNLPLKRRTVANQKNGNIWTETCEYQLNAKNEAKLFEVPK